MSIVHLRVRRFSLVLALIGAGFTIAVRPDGVPEERTPVQQHHANGVADYRSDAAVGVASIEELVGDWPEPPCRRSDEQPAPVAELWNLVVPRQPERPLGYSVLDHCTPIFIDRGGKHSSGDLWGGMSIVTEGFYERTSTGGRIEVNPNALMQKTERYRAQVLAHEELHAVLDWLEPAGLNETILPAHVVARARTQLREGGYEAGDVDDEILPRLLTHDSEGTGLNGVAEEDRVIREAMRRLLAEAQTDPALKRVYGQLQRSHALAHDLLSGKARIGALMCGPEHGPKLQTFARP
jgi:hypothetical protein